MNLPPTGLDACDFLIDELFTAFLKFPFAFENCEKFLTCWLIILDPGLEKEDTYLKEGLC